jgi:hypothetical protein
MEWFFRYTDSNGTIETALSSDGKKITANIRGIVFQGDDFDSLQPIGNYDPKVLETFTLCSGQLCGCKIECMIEIPVQSQGTIMNGLLDVSLVLGSPQKNGALDSEKLNLRLRYDNQAIVSSGLSGWFEDELLEIQQKLPSGTYMKACINCLYSDYSPYGHGLFGWMMCFRNVKNDYLKVKCKDDFWKVHDHFEKMVQETYLCEEFERRISGTGYRG